VLRNLCAAAVLSTALAWPQARAADTVIVRGQAFVNKGLVGVGRIAADLRDTFGETFGSGSGVAVDPKTWMRTADGYRGEFFLLPDRGYISRVRPTSRGVYASIALKPIENPATLPVLIASAVSSQRLPIRSRASR
jgi:hypothetical protein